MALPPITSISGIGTEFQLPKLEGVTAPKPAGDGDGFGNMLAEQIGKLADMQAEGAQQAQALATGQAEDVSQVVMAVERASLSLSMAATVRNKAVEAYQELFRMQV
jgi:flagellar hook-basal body complex protein FliE